MVRGGVGTWSDVGVGVTVLESRSSMSTVVGGECQTPSEVLQGDSVVGHCPRFPRARTCRQARQRRYRGVWCW
jgi:hypothetical protein